MSEVKIDFKSDQVLSIKEKTIVQKASGFLCKVRAFKHITGSIDVEDRYMDATIGAVCIEYIATGEIDVFSTVEVEEGFEYIKS